MHLVLNVVTKPVEQPTKSCKKQNKKLNQQVLNKIKGSNSNKRPSHTHDRYL